MVAIFGILITGLGEGKNKLYLIIAYRAQAQFLGFLSWRKERAHFCLACLIFSTALDCTPNSVYILLLHQKCYCEVHLLYWTPIQGQMSHDLLTIITCQRTDQGIFSSLVTAFQVSYPSAPSSAWLTPDRGQLRLKTWLLYPHHDLLACHRACLHLRMFASNPQGSPCCLRLASLALPMRGQRGTFYLLRQSAPSLWGS